DGQIAPQLTTGGGKPGQGQPCIAFSAKDHGADAAEGVSPTLRAGGHGESHANAGVMPAIAFDALAGGDTGFAVGDVPGALHGGGKHGGRAAVAFQERGRDGGRSLEYQEDVAYALTAPSGGGRAQERNVA